MLDEINKQTNDGLMLIQKYSDQAIDYALKYSVQVVIAILILLLGFWIANKIANALLASCAKHKMDVSLSHFFANVIRVVVLSFVFLMAMDKLGITISPLIAAVSAMIFGASFALQAPLSNFAAGLIVILTRPYVVGNTITINGVSGIVEEIKLPCTVLINEDGEKITIPNKHVVGEVLFNSEQNKVVERTIGISYLDDPKKAIALILDVLKSFPQISQKHQAQVGIDKFGESSLIISLRYWVPTMQYNKTLFEVNLAIYEALSKAGITIPFPQSDVHIKSKL